jgi:hypothetical protein
MKRNKSPAANATCPRQVNSQIFETHTNHCSVRVSFPNYDKLDLPTRRSVPFICLKISALGVANMKRHEIAEKLKLAYGGPMSDEEVSFLRDFEAFIDFAIRNGLSFRATMAYLSHDWNEFARYGFDFDGVVKMGFSPRVTGFSDATTEAVGEPE